MSKPREVGMVPPLRIRHPEFPDLYIGSDKSEVDAVDLHNFLATMLSHSRPWGLVKGKTYE